MTDATSIGPKLSIAMVPSTISATNNVPAMGALYAEVMPAAEPHATRSRSRDVRNFAIRPMIDAQVADNCTIDPSRPIEPPDATENSDEMLRATLWRTGIRPSPID